jgi:ribonucleoside-diphosphate reductase alpha chain
MPADSTPDDISHAYLESWRLGLKAVAVYRDGCKRSQPLSTSRQPAPDAARPLRRKLPDERRSITHKYSIAGHEGYITAGMYEDGKPGEIFLVMAKEGSTISGLMDAFATAISMALQYGVPLEALVEKFSHVRFEPSGFTKNPEVPYAKSITDYIFRWLAAKFLPPEAREDAAEGLADGGARPEAETPVTPRALPLPAFRSQADAPSCHYCGSIMTRNGSCYRCANCGSTSGCS